MPCLKEKEQKTNNNLQNTTQAITHYKKKITTDTFNRFNINLS